MSGITLKPTGTTTINNSPGGSGTEVQYKNGGNFGGVAGSSWDGAILTLPTTTIATANGNIFEVDANLNPLLTGYDSLGVAQGTLAFGSDGLAQLQGVSSIAGDGTGQLSGFDAGYFNSVITNTVTASTSVETPSIANSSGTFAVSGTTGITLGTGGGLTTIDGFNGVASTSKWTLTAPGSAGGTPAATTLIIKRKDSDVTPNTAILQSWADENDVALLWVGVDGGIYSTGAFDYDRTNEILYMGNSQFTATGLVINGGPSLSVAEGVNTAQVITPLVTRDLGDLTLSTTTSGDVKISTAGKLNIAGLPTSAAGLASGDIWLNSNVLTIVP